MLIVIVMWVISTSKTPYFRYTFLVRIELLCFFHEFKILTLYERNRERRKGVFGYGFWVLAHVVSLEEVLMQQVKNEIIFKRAKGSLGCNVKLERKEKPYS